MANVVKGLYRHIATGQPYKVIGVGRSVENPNNFIVIYEQLYESKLKGTDTLLPEGSLWTRDIDDYRKKFIKCCSL